MKKLFLMFAVAGLMASCAGNGTTSGSASASGEVKDGETTEKVAEQATDAEVPIEEQKELDANAYNLKVPENWKPTSRVVGGNSCNLRLRENPFTTAMLGYNSESLEAITANLTKNEFKPVDDITAGDKTWKVFFLEKNNEYKALIPQGEGFVTIGVSPGGTTMDKAELKEVVLKNLNEMINAITIK
ncbi:MAG: hypothetical protein SPL28_06810 [Bacteroidales bacterium]|nr:hypothetical protein [Bacteroidales bacterium]